jgi:hypothetical protein
MLWANGSALSYYNDDYVFLLMVVMPVFLVARLLL